jgi:surfeit locus 1 family protein
LGRLKVTGRGIAATLLVMLIAGACIRLGFWQLDRLEQRRARNAALRSALALPPLQVEGEVVEALMRKPSAYLNRRVRVRGIYDPAGEVVLRGRAHGGRPGVHLVTPLRIRGSGAAILVDRGWVPSPNAATVDPRGFREPEAREVTGILQPISRSGDPVPLPIEIDGLRVPSYQRLDLATLRGRSADPLLPVYLRQLPDSAGGEPPLRSPLPEMDEGPHLGYAIQWFSFAAIAVIGFLILLFRSRPSTNESP